MLIYITLIIWKVYINILDHFSDEVNSIRSFQLIDFIVRSWRHLEPIWPFQICHGGYQIKLTGIPKPPLHETQPI